ncbi:unnamed protein product, partial [Symbiodinium sp. KB8]
HSDAQNSSALEEDLCEDENGDVTGFLEARIERSKTSTTLERKTRWLPMVATIHGISDQCWGLEWMKVLAENGPPLGPGRPLLPGPMDNGQWQNVPLSPEASARWLRGLLYRHPADFPKNEIHELGTHSLKATLLSWSSKYGSVLVYGRDNISQPLRELDEVIRADEERPDHRDEEEALQLLDPWVGPGLGNGLIWLPVETIASSVKTLKNLAFISSYSPGQADDAPLMEVLSTLLSAYAVVTAELKQQVERYDKQVKRLSGVSIKGSSEPSERLVDVCVAIYERNQLQYVPWSRPCSAGALAMEQANIVSYTLLDLWHQRLMKARLTDPPPGYSRPSFDQLRLADQELFSELQDETRSGIQALSSGRPVDNLIKDVMHRAEVSSLLLPLPAPSAASIAKSAATVPPPQPTWKGNGKGKGKLKGKTGRMGTPRMPAELEGCKAYTQKGKPLCYDFNMSHGCCRSVKNNECQRGLHNCTWPGCGGAHSASSCPKRMGKKE